VKAGIRATLSSTVIERPVAFESANAVSFAVEGLDDLLLTSSVFIVCEDALLRLLLNFGFGSQFLNHIQFGLLGEEGVSLLAEHFKIPPESVWEF
jgi:hypothetical protein